VLYATEFHSLHATVYLFTYFVHIDIIHRKNTPYIWRYRQWHANYYEKSWQNFLVHNIDSLKIIYKKLQFCRLPHSDAATYSCPWVKTGSWVSEYQWNRDGSQIFSGVPYSLTTTHTINSRTVVVCYAKRIHVQWGRHRPPVASPAMGHVMTFLVVVVSLQYTLATPQW